MKLSDKEQELKKILELVSIGLNNTEISVKMNYSRSTVKRRIKDLFKIYQVNNRFRLGQEYLMERLA